MLRVLNVVRVCALATILAACVSNASGNPDATGSYYTSAMGGYH